MNIIYWEILQWIVDGTNVVFTTQKNISSMIEVNIGGLPTTSYTIDGRRIVFNTAPLTWTDSPTVDYYWEEVCSFTSDVVTLQTVLDDVIDTIGITQFNTPYPETTAIKRINEAYKQTKNTIGMQVKGTLAYTKGGSYSYWEFERLDLVNTTSALWNFVPRVGRIMIWNSIVEYNTRTESSFTLTSPSTFTPQSNDVIIPWYKLPTCVKEVEEVRIDWIKQTGVDFSDWTSLATTNVYTIKDGYIYYGFISDEATVDIVYLSDINSFTLWADVIDIPEEYTAALSDYASWKMLQNREDERWQGIHERWKLEKRKWKAFINRQSKGGNNKPFFDWPLNNI